ncbi:Gfo/Idh/MocA family protein [Paenibacillus piri]|uniref:Gfo/Idh/MocA family protein n=1 Tax=Paenibacillus piri TaxID=2547395 RepID=UPI0014050813|nr:Gfo/Idh/MocA family oxidoreductase [Paenibacillus piri]
MEHVKICIIGAGRLASKRIYPYIAAAGGKLTGVCDLDRGKAEEKAYLYGGRAYTKVEAMLSAERPDGVIVCVGPEQHYELSQTILRLGFPVYTEKPPAPSARLALETARLSKETGLLCTTAFKKRYSTAYNRAKDWLSQFDPSELVSLSVDYASAPYANTSPRSEFLLDFAIHCIDATGYLFGDAQAVFCFAKGMDGYAVSVKYVNGAVGSFNFNCARSFAIPTEEVEISVYGRNFMTIHNSSCWKITEQDKTIEWREPPTFVSNGDSGNDTGHLAELADYFVALREGRTTRSDIYESYKSMVLYEAIKSSAETGQVVPVVFESL